jgi:phospholipid transport system transporter-binding protein
LPDAVRHDDAGPVRLAGERVLDETSGGVEFSLAPLKESNSVVVALLLAWVRYAQMRNKSIRFVDVPDDLRNIIELYGVADILPVEGGSPGSAWSIADDTEPSQVGSPSGPEGVAR